VKPTALGGRDMSGGAGERRLHPHRSHGVDERLLQGELPALPDEKTDVTWVGAAVARSGGLFEGDVVAHGFELTDGVASLLKYPDRGRLHY
jgi:hypothetical protein